MAIDCGVKYQYLAAACVNIISLSYGAFCAWPSASFLVLQSEESPLETGRMSESDAGWVGAMVCFGGALGTVTFAYCADKFGRRRSLMLIAIPSLIGWLIIPYAKNPLHLCISRIFGGFAGGGAFGVIPLYVTEIAENRVRGALGSLLLMSCNFGVLMAFTLGHFFSYATVAWIMLVPSVLFLACFTFLPETPQHLMRQDKALEAEKAFRYFRNIRDAVPVLSEELKTELEKLKCDDQPESKIAENSKEISLKDFTNPVARKAFVLGVFLMSVNQFCGLFTLLNYTATIFKISGSHMSPNMSAIVIGVIQIFGSYISTFLVDRVGRKILLSASAIGTALGLITLGSYIYLNDLGFDLSSFAWIPVASFSFTFFIACWGVLPLPFIITAEIMPPKIRNVGCMFSMLCLWTFAFTLLKLLPVLIQWIGLYGVLFFFGGYCLAAVLFVFIFVPETRGKSIEAIMAML